MRWPRYEVLAASRRWAEPKPPAAAVLGTADQAAPWELAALVASGVLAAVATVCLDMGLRVPGHAILRCVFPMSLGLAIAPRRMGGSVMGASALATGWLLQTGGHFSAGAGAMTSLAAIGPMLDFSLWWVRKPSHIYFAMALAGCGTNLLAMGMRGGAKLGGGGGRALESWFPVAAVTYPLCGLLAGIISAVVWFRFSARQHRE